MKRDRRLRAGVALVVVLCVLVLAAGLAAQTSQPRSPSSPAASLAAVVDLVTGLFPRVSGEVLEVQGTSVTISVGRRDGIQPGLELGLFREGRELRHPKTGEVLGRTEKALGRLRIEQVEEAYAVGTVPAGTEVGAGDIARISAGKQRVTVLPIVTGVRDTLVEAALAEIVEGLTATGRFQVAIGDHVGVWATQQGITPDQLFDGQGLPEAGRRFKIDHVLALQFRTVQRRPYVEARFYSLPSTAPLATSATFIPPSVRSASSRDRFSSGGDRQPPQPRQRSLLARIIGGELEAGTYSSGEGSIPLREIGRFAFPIVGMDVSVAPQDQVPRVVLTDGNKIWLYRVSERALEPEWTYDEWFTTPGRIVSVQLADLDGDGVLEVVANRYHPDPQILFSAFILASKDGKPVTIVKETGQILLAVDPDGAGVKKTLWSQAFSPETFFRPGQMVRQLVRGDKLVADGMARVPSNFRPTGAAFSNIAGKNTRTLAYVDEYNRLRLAVGSEETWRSSSPVGGGAFMRVELLKAKTERGGRSEFYHFEPTPLSVDLDGDGVEEILIPQNQLTGHVAIVFRGPAGYRFQSVFTGFEGVITALGAIPGGNPPSLVAAVVRFNDFLKTSGETQIIMTTGE